MKERLYPQQVPVRVQRRAPEQRMMRVRRKVQGRVYVRVREPGPESEQAVPVVRGHCKPVRAQDSVRENRV